MHSNLFFVTFSLETRNFADICKRISIKWVTVIRVWVNWYEIERQKFGGLIELGLAMLISDFYLDQYWIKFFQINFLRKITWHWPVIARIQRYLDVNCVLVYQFDYYWKYLDTGTSEHQWKRQSGDFIVYVVKTVTNLPFFSPYSKQTGWHFFKNCSRHQNHWKLCLWRMNWCFLLVKYHYDYIKRS